MATFRSSSLPARRDVVDSEPRAPRGFRSGCEPAAPPEREREAVDGDARVTGRAIRWSWTRRTSTTGTGSTRPARSTATDEHGDALRVHRLQDDDDTVTITTQLYLRGRFTIKLPDERLNWPAGFETYLKRRASKEPRGSTGGLLGQVDRLNHRARDRTRRRVRILRVLFDPSWFLLALLWLASRTSHVDARRAEERLEAGLVHRLRVGLFRSHELLRAPDPSARRSSRTMPIALPTCMIDGIWNVFASRIRLRDRAGDDQHLERRDAAAADLPAQRLRDDAPSATPTA